VTNQVITKTTDFDAPVFKDFLDARFGTCCNYNLERVSGGQSNPTYIVTHGSQRLVLCKKPKGVLLRGAHAIDREYRVLSALHPNGMPLLQPMLYYYSSDFVGTLAQLFAMRALEVIEGRH
jgi:aminoglycoside phosphotransferase (APT) family kinase protein